MNHVASPRQNSTEVVFGVRQSVQILEEHQKNGTYSGFLLLVVFRFQKLGNLECSRNLETCSSLGTVSVGFCEFPSYNPLENCT
jgi:hypothetical protein